MPFCQVSNEGFFQVVVLIQKLIYLPIFSMLLVLCTVIVYPHLSVVLSGNKSFMKSLV